MALVEGIQNKAWLTHTPIHVHSMKELHEMEGATPPGAGGPPEMAGGGMMALPDLPGGPDGPGFPPVPKDLTAAVWVDNGAISEKSRTSALHGGELTAEEGKLLRISTYDGKVGGVYVTGGD